ncbi:hypothetical protein ABID22_000113 [Pontibacter aydingkolensis]
MKKTPTLWQTATKTTWGRVFLVVAVLAALNLVRLITTIL